MRCYFFCIFSLSIILNLNFGYTHFIFRKLFKNKKQTN